MRAVSRGRAGRSRPLCQLSQRRREVGRASALARAVHGCQQDRSEGEGSEGGQGCPICHAVAGSLWREAPRTPAPLMCTLSCIEIPAPSGCQGAPSPQLGHPSQSQSKATGPFCWRMHTLPPPPTATAANPSCQEPQSETPGLSSLSPWEKYPGAKPQARGRPSSVAAHCGADRCQPAQCLLSSHL